MQKPFSHDTRALSASNQIIVDDAFITEMHRKAGKLRANAFTQLANIVATGINIKFVSIIKWFNSKIQESHVMNQLYSMDDRALADIGLTRGDIESVLNGTWSRETVQPLANNLQLIHNTKANKALAVHENTSIAA